MSFIERSAAFPPAGAAAWPPCEAPVWRGGRPCPAPFAASGWWHPQARLALDFRNGRYMRGGAEIGAGALLAVTRSSGIVIPNAAGVFQTIGNNALPRTDRGLYANGQIAALNANGNNPQSATGWGNQGSPTLVNGPIEGIFSTLYVSGSGTARRQTAIITVGGAVTLAAKVSYGPGTDPSASAVIVLSTPGGNWVFSGAPGALTATQTGSGSVTIVRNDAGEFWFLHTTSGAGDVRVGLGSGDATKDIKLRGIDVTQTGFVPDAWISDASPAPTLLASDIRAVQGVRPSNGQDEPFAGWGAAGLDAACGGIAKVLIGRLSAVSARFITGAGVDAGNLWRVVFDTDNRFKMILRKSGSDVLTLQSGVVSTLGPKEVVWQAKPGDYALDATDVAGATSASSEALPAGPTTLRIGSSFSAATPFNGWIEELQILGAV